MQGSKGKDFYIEYSSSKVQFSSATSMYQIESVVTKKHEIEKRQCIKKTTFGKIWTIKFLMQGTNQQFTGEWFGTSKKLSIENLIDRTEQVFREIKYSIIEVFKKMWHFFPITGISGFWRKEEKQRFLHGIRFYR